MRRFRSWCLAAGALFAAGCIESKMVIHLKPDGSGTIISEDFFSPQATTMMTQFGAALAGTGTTAAASDPLGMFKDQIERKTKELGGRARLVNQEPATNATGWAGFRLTYTFDDIQQVSLPVGGSDAEPEEDDSKKPETFRVEFERGRPAVLRLLPPATAAKPAEVPPTAAPPPDANNAQMAAMMAPMMAGMRMAMEIRVNGTIVSAEGADVSADRRSVTLLDVAVDKLLGNAQAMQLMMNKGLSDSEKSRQLKQLNIAGVTITDPNRPIVIKFE